MAAVGALGTLAFPWGRQKLVAPGRRVQATRSERAASLSAVSLAGLGQPLELRPAWERRATEAARSWLRLVDDERHAASWENGAPLLRDSATSSDWEKALRAVRTPLGRCLRRTPRSRTAVQGPAGDLSGPYVVLRFESAFERGRVTETVTAVRGADRRWRVAAYFIR
jgi:hypothetical protein